MSCACLTNPHAAWCPLDTTADRRVPLALLQRMAALLERYMDNEENLCGGVDCGACSHVREVNALRADLAKMLDGK